jgi:hypothetical protein
MNTITLKTNNTIQLTRSVNITNIKFFINSTPGVPNGTLFLDNVDKQLIVYRNRNLSELVKETVTVTNISSIFNASGVVSNIIKTITQTVTINPLNNLYQSTTITVLDTNTGQYVPLNSYNRNANDWIKLADTDYFKFLKIAKTTHSHDFSVYENTNTFASHMTSTNAHTLTLQNFNISLNTTTLTNLCSSNNLLEFAGNKNKAKANLGIGPISNYDCGVNAGQILKLQEDNKLPVLDGSLLRIPSSKLEIANKYTGRKNLFINGNFAVKQRKIKTSATQVIDNQFILSNSQYNYTFDCWLAKGSSPIETKHLTISEIDASNSPSMYICKLTGATDLAYRFEDCNLLNNKTCVLSFYYKTSTNVSLSLSYYRRYNLGDYDSVTTITPITGSLLLTNTNDKFIRTYIKFKINNADISKVLDNRQFFHFNLSFSNSCELTNFQLELSNEMTSYEYLPYDYTWLMCQRYYMVYIANYNGTNYEESQQLNWGMVESPTFGLMSLPLYINHNKFYKLQLEALTDTEIVTYTSSEKFPVNKSNITLVNANHSFANIKFIFDNQLAVVDIGNWFLLNKTTIIVLKWEL